MKFHFHHLHPRIKIGTASDRYAGWLGQIYSEERYKGRITRRNKVVWNRSLIEEVLPADSVEEYFEHLEIDFTFYRPLLDQNGKPTQNYQVLQKYLMYLKEADHLLLKVPFAVMAPKLRHGGGYRENPIYLNPAVFTNQFYTPATEFLGRHLRGFIFEQEYLRKEDKIMGWLFMGANCSNFKKFFFQKNFCYHTFYK